VIAGAEGPDHHIRTVEFVAVLSRYKQGALGIFVAFKLGCGVERDALPQFKAACPDPAREVDGCV